MTQFIIPVTKQNIMIIIKYICKSYQFLYEAFNNCALVYTTAMKISKGHYKCE
jgi:hypothetical protein